MKDGTLTAMLSSLPDQAAMAGIRAQILHEGLEGNLVVAEKAFEQVWEMEGHEGIKAELTEFLVARHAYRGNLETARNLYARFGSLGTSGDILQAQAAALHILACMVMDVKLAEAIKLWRDYVHLRIPAQYKKLSAFTGFAELRQALKNSDSRSADLVFSTLCALAQETGDAKIAIRAKEIFEKEVWRKW